MVSSRKQPWLYDGVIIEIVSIAQVFYICIAGYFKPKAASHCDVPEVDYTSMEHTIHAGDIHRIIIELDLYDK